jgi:hypothetical protein
LLLLRSWGLSAAKTHPGSRGRFVPCWPDKNAARLKDRRQKSSPVWPRASPVRVCSLERSLGPGLRFFANLWPPAGFDLGLVLREKKTSLNRILDSFKKFKVLARKEERRAVAGLDFKHRFG